MKVITRTVEEGPLAVVQRDRSYVFYVQGERADIGIDVEDPEDLTIGARYRITTILEEVE